LRVRPLVDRGALAEPSLAPSEDPSRPRYGPLQARRKAGHVLPYECWALATGRGAGGCEECGSKRVSRPKKILPVLGQTPEEPEVGEPEAAHTEADGCTDGCCSDAEAVEPSAATPRIREANPETPEGGAPLGLLERTVVRVEGMDCASCAATVERRVSALPGVSRATVNFAAGRLDAEHDPGLPLEELEGPSGSPGTKLPKPRRTRGRRSGAPRGRCLRRSPPCCSSRA